MGPATAATGACGGGGWARVSHWWGVGWRAAAATTVTTTAGSSGGASGRMSKAGEILQAARGPL